MLMRSQVFELKQGLYDVIVARAVERGESVSANGAALANEVSSALFFNRVVMGRRDRRGLRLPPGGRRDPPSSPLLTHHSRTIDE